MALFNRKHKESKGRTKRAFSFNPWACSPAFVGKNKYSEVVLLTLLNKIQTGLRDATWIVNNNHSIIDAQRLQVFLNENTCRIYRKLFFDGYARITRDKWGFVLLNKNDKKDFWIEIETDEYKERQKSKFSYIKPYLTALDTKINADCSITENLGALGILAPKDSTGMSNFEDDEKELLQKDWAQLYGITNKKWSMLITQRAVEYQPIKLPIEELKLGEGIERLIKIICGFVGVPYELYPLSGQSTYNNREQALIELYSFVVPEILNLIYDEIKSPLMLEGYNITWNLKKYKTE